MSEDQIKFSAFISYATESQEKAQEICEVLEQKGKKCWIAPRNIRAGKEYGEEIINGIKNSNCLVLVLCDAANESPFVRREVERAVSLRKPVFPIRVEEILPSPKLELFVSATHWIDAWTGDFVEHIDKLALDMSDKKIAASSTSDAPLPQRKRKPSKLLVYAGGFAALVLAIVAANYLSSFREQTQIPTQEELTDLAGDYYSRAHGLDLETLKADDVDLKFTSDRFRGETSKISFAFIIKGQELGVSTTSKVQVKIGDGPSNELNLFNGTIPSRYIDQELLRNSNTIYVTFLPIVGSGKSREFTFDYDIEETFENLALDYAKSEDYQIVNHISSDTIGLWLRAGASPYGKLHLGESSGNLDRVIELQDPFRLYQASGEYQGFINLSYVPVRKGSDYVYSQLEFVDGTKGSIVETILKQDESLLQFADGVALNPENGNGPKLFVHFDGKNLVFVPDLPVYTTSVGFSFDEGGYFPAETRYGSEPYWRYTFEGPITAPFVRIQFSVNGRGEVGPFTYTLDDNVSLVRTTMKLRFNYDPVELVRPIRLKPEHFPDPQGGSSRSADKVEKDVAKNRPDLSPGLYVMPYYRSNPRELAYWLAVKAVAVGSRPGELGDPIPINCDIKDYFAGQFTDKVKPYTLFAGKLPDDSTGAYIKYFFHDGTESTEYRLTIDN